VIIETDGACVRLPGRCAGLSGVKSIACGANHNVAVTVRIILPPACACAACQMPEPPVLGLRAAALLRGAVELLALRKWSWRVSMSPMCTSASDGQEPVFQCLRSVCLWVRVPCLSFSSREYAPCQSKAVYSWGAGGCGQLGHGGRGDELAPREITALTNKGVCEASCGYSHTLFRTDEGRLLACGSNEFGQLLIGEAWTESLGVVDVSAALQGAPACTGLRLCDAGRGS